MVVYDPAMARSLQEIVAGKFDVDPVRVTKAANLLAEMERARMFGAGLLPAEPAPVAVAAGPPLESIRAASQAAYRAVHAPANPVTFEDMKGGDILFRVTIPAAHAAAKGIDSAHVFKIVRKGPEPVTTERGVSTVLPSIYFASVLHAGGSHYLGVFEPVMADIHKGIRITKASKFKDNHPVFKLLAYVLRQLAKNLPLLDGYTIERV